MDIYIRAISSFFPENKLNVDDIAKIERFQQDVDQLKTLGINEFYVASDYSSISLAATAANKHVQKNNIPIEDYDLVIYSHFWNEENWNEMHTFRLHHDIGLNKNCTVMEIKAGNQTSLFQAIDTASKYLLSGMKNIMIICADKLDTRFVRRKINEGIIGDGAGVLTLSTQNGIAQITSKLYSLVKSDYYLINMYDSEYSDDINNTISDLSGKIIAQISEDKDLNNIKQIITQNYQLHNLKDGFSQGKLSKIPVFDKNISKYGHVPTAGFIINLNSYFSEANSNDEILLWSSAMGVSIKAMTIKIIQKEKL